MSNVTEFAALFNTAPDAKRFERSAGVLLTLLYLHVALTLIGWAPAWSLAISTPILVVRWMFAVHELFHLKSEREVGPLTRLMPLLLTPLSIGYREHLEMHRGHHRHMATPADPEYFQLRGNKFVGFVNALTAPEQAFVRWVAAHGLDRELVAGTLVRLVLFAALAWASGPLFLWYWVPVRLSHATSFFSFFYLLHRRGAEFGVYRTVFPRWAASIYSVLFGRETLLGICYHDLHHQQPRVAATRLPEIA